MKNPLTKFKSDFLFINICFVENNTVCFILIDIEIHYCEFYCIITILLKFYYCYKISNYAECVFKDYLIYSVIPLKFQSNTLLQWQLKFFYAIRDVKNMIYDIYNYVYFLDINLKLRLDSVQLKTSVFLTGCIIIMNIIVLLVILCLI